MSSISQHYFKGILEHLVELGFSEQEILGSLSVPVSFSTDETHRLDSARYYELLELAASLTNDDLYGATLGARIALSDYGVLGYLVASCNNLMKAIEVLLDFDALVADIGKAELIITGDVATIRWHPEDAATQQSILRNSVAWINSVTHLLGDNYQPTALDFSFDLSEQNHSRLTKLVRCTINVKQTYNAIHFASDLLTIPFKGHNALVFSALKQASDHALSQLTEPSLVSQRVALLLEQRSDLVNCQQHEIARELAISTRQLQRKLQHENTRFSELLERERKRRALQLLGSHSMLAIAQQLGFAEQASFNHAFKRWFGVSPTNYLSQ